MQSLKISIKTSFISINNLKHIHIRPVKNSYHFHSLLMRISPCYPFLLKLSPLEILRTFLPSEQWGWRGWIPIFLFHFLLDKIVHFNDIGIHWVGPYHFFFYFWQLFAFKRRSKWFLGKLYVIILMKKTLFGSMV